ncbi:hypothetical protein [Nocardioides nanhaiensis]
MNATFNSGAGLNSATMIGAVKFIAHTIVTTATTAFRTPVGTS